MVGLEGYYSVKASLKFAMESNKPKETLKEKLSMVINQVRAPLLLFFFILPIIAFMGYSLGFPMLNMWDLFVEYLFGSFWLAIAFLILMFFLILMLGGISYYTVIIFLLYFILAMTIGYGYPLFTVAIAIFGTMYCIYQVFKWLENR
jgi:uncharacterized protein YybS (DUF2232 family)